MMIQTKLMKRILPIIAFAMSAVLVQAQCWYVDDATDSVCTTDPDACIPITYPDGSSASFIEALSIDPSGSPVYAADGGQVGILDPLTGIFTPFANASGYGDLDGLAFDPSTGKLYASIRSGGNDELVCIETTGPNAGLPVAGTEVEVTGSGSDVDELTVPPNGCAGAGVIYATISTATGFVLATIDPATGVATEIGPFGIPDVESITFDANCNLYANNGAGELYLVDQSTGAVIGDPLFNVSGNDVEGMSCEDSTPFAGCIGDAIWEDLDGDGVQDPGESGISGVIVNLLDEFGDPVLDPAGNPITTTTDENGEYKFPNLPAGDYSVEIDPENFGEGKALDGYTQTFDEDGGLDATIDVTISTGDEYTTADFGFFIVALPVEFVKFEANEKDGHVTLEWVTANEVNSDYFSVEHSTNGYDYKEIGKVQAAGNATTLRTYNYTDRNAVNGQNFYRLKQIDLNAKSMYSDVKVVKLANNKSARVYPNPFTDKINIESDFDTFVITNSVGKILRQGSVDQGQIDLSNLQEGMYMVTFYSGEESFSQKIFKR